MQGLEYVIRQLEQYEQLQKRPRVFAANSTEKELQELRKAASSPDHVPAVDKTEKLKQLGFELVDIGLHVKELSKEYVQQSPAYQSV